MSYFTFQAASVKMPSLFDSKNPGGILILILYFLSLKQHLNSMKMYTTIRGTIRDDDRYSPVAFLQKIVTCQ